MTHSSVKPSEYFVQGKLVRVAKERKVKTWRKIIEREFAWLKPTEGRHKIYLFELIVALPMRKTDCGQFQMENVV